MSMLIQEADLFLPLQEIYTCRLKKNPLHFLIKLFYLHIIFN